MLTALWCALYLVGCAIGYIWWAMPRVTEIIWHSSLAQSTLCRVCMHLGAYGMFSILWPLQVTMHTYDAVFGPADEDEE